MWRNESDRYGYLAIALHWSMAVGVFGLFALGLWMTSLEYFDPWYHRAPDVHKSIGVLLLLLLPLRWLWRQIDPPPQPLGEPWERALALFVHRLHYLLLAGVLASGYLLPTAEGAGVDCFGWFTLPSLVSLDARQVDAWGRAHLWLAWSAVLLACLHAAAALKHHILDRDATLLRMLGITRGNEEDRK